MRKPWTVRQVRELVTFVGFVVMTVGIGGACGVFVAMLVSGGLVFGLGLVGMTRR